MALVRTGTALEDVTLVDAIDLVSLTNGVKITTGSAYPRFGSQSGFRRALREAFLDAEPQYSEIALDGLSRTIQRLGDGKSDHLVGDDLADLVDVVAAEHEDVIRNDAEFGLRQYAIRQLQIEATTGPREDDRHRATAALERMRERDTLVNEEWSKVVQTLAEQAGVAKLSDLDYGLFEIALTAFRDGLLVRQATSDVPEGTLAKLVGTFLLGFFEEPEKAEKTTLRDELAALLGRAERTSLLKVTQDSQRALNPDPDLDAIDNLNVRRAMAILPKRTPL